VTNPPEFTNQQIWGLLRKHSGLKRTTFVLLVARELGLQASDLPSKMSRKRTLLALSELASWKDILPAAIKVATEHGGEIK